MGAVCAPPGGLRPARPCCPAACAPAGVHLAVRPTLPQAHLASRHSPWPALSSQPAGISLPSRHRPCAGAHECRPSACISLSPAPSALPPCPPFLPSPPPSPAPDLPRTCHAAPALHAALAGTRTASGPRTRLLTSEYGPRMPTPSTRSVRLRPASLGRAGFSWASTRLSLGRVLVRVRASFCVCDFPSCACASPPPRVPRPRHTVPAREAGFAWLRAPAKVASVRQAARPSQGSYG